MSSRSTAKKTSCEQQQHFFFNRPALPRAETSQPNPQPKSRETKQPSPHSPLAQTKYDEIVGRALRDRQIPVPQSVTATKPEPTPADLIQNLQNQIRKLETVSRHADLDTVSTGCLEMDQLLPEQGLVRGTIVEWLAGGPGSSAATLALIAARNACYESGASTSTDTSSNRQIGTLVVVDPHGSFYPPAASAWGIDLKNTIVLRPNNAADQNWALQQSLNCPAVAAVWAMIDEIDERAFRRFQLAAEQSGCLGLFHRPATVRHQPSWSEIQLAVKPLPAIDNSDRYRGRRLRVQLLKCRGGSIGKRIELEINEATGTIRAATARTTSKPPAKKTSQPIRTAKHA